MQFPFDKLVGDSCMSLKHHPTLRRTFARTLLTICPGYVPFSNIEAIMLFIARH